MKRLLRWGSNLITIALAIILVITVYTAISSRLTRGNPTVFGLRWYEVLSGSMEPNIHTGSVIFDKPNVNVNNLKVGDIITFRASPDEFPGYAANKGELLVTHRIQSVVKQGGQLAFQTKGDANRVSDPTLISANNVIGQYANVTIPYLGYYLDFSKTKLGIGLLLVLPGALLVISSLVTVFKDVARDQARETKEVSKSKDV